MHIQVHLIALFLSYLCIVEAVGVRGYEDEQNLRKLKSQKSPKTPKSPKARKKKKDKKKKQKLATPSSIPSNMPSQSQEPTGCKNDPTWIVKNTDGTTVSCSSLEQLRDTLGFTEERICKPYAPPIDLVEEKTAFEACCICGGSINVSRYPSMTPSSSLSQRPSELL
ncbi:predicted protein [Chaetoceros tenuissimus]|uniref:Secreted protein n=1 Tax=Chaetoceros tenuissimus TaxID=426638 RepID=A0AAD3CLZ4_9STRA|nr:predicted protein [Chaetoceros tenuissimus]